MAKAGITFKVDGMKELEAALADLGRSTGMRVLDRSMRKAAKPMLDAAKRNTPYDEGDLEESLVISKRTTDDAGKAAFARVMRESGGDAGAARAALRDAYRAEGGPVSVMYLGPAQGVGAGHAHLVEFGTGPRFHKDGQFVGEMPADPFLRPAFDQEAQPTITRLKGILWEEIRKTTARKAARQAKKAGWEV